MISLFTHCNKNNGTIKKTVNFTFQFKQMSFMTSSTSLYILYLFVMQSIKCMIVFKSKRVMSFPQVNCVLLTEISPSHIVQSKCIIPYI